jgi:hypothetical protein
LLFSGFGKQKGNPHISGETKFCFLEHVIDTPKDERSGDLGSCAPVISLFLKIPKYYLQVSKK